MPSRVVVVAPRGRPPDARRLARMGWDVECELEADRSGSITLMALERAWKRAKAGARGAGSTMSSSSSRPSSAPSDESSTKATTKVATFVVEPWVEGRPRLEKDVAVLLMRASNVAAEKLMSRVEEFRARLAEIREVHWEAFAAGLRTEVQRGDFADPYFFDYISWAQYAAISDFVSDVEEHAHAVGKAMFADLRTRYKLRSFSARDAAGSLRHLFDCLRRAGFCVSVSVDSEGRAFKCALKAPANLWSTRTFLLLAEAPAAAKNDFELKLLRAYLRPKRVAVVSLATEVREDEVVHTFQLQQQPPRV